MTVDYSVTEKALKALIEGILQVAQPVRIILFGSAARGQMGPHSDLDVLVIMPNGAHRRQTAERIYRNLAGLRMPKDVVVVTEADVEAYGDNPSLVIFPALAEGKEVYRAPD